MDPNRPWQQPPSGAAETGEQGLERHERLMSTLFSCDEIERFYARFDQLPPPSLE